ncbi:MAG: hypothetical protein J6R04_05030, partial [Clostridia bacterium]|nr:hypothetical protein [Clostridia bacterium]
MAVVFVTRVENGNKKSEGLCLRCAKELGLPIDNMLSGTMLEQMGLTPDQLAGMEDEVNQMLEGGAPDIDVNLTAEDDEGGEDEASQGKKGDHVVPTFDFRKIFTQAGLIKDESPNVVPGKDTADNGNEPRKKGKADPDKKYKFLPVYCRNLTKNAAEGKLDR